MSNLDDFEPERIYEESVDRVKIEETFQRIMKQYGEEQKTRASGGYSVRNNSNINLSIQSSTPSKKSPSNKKTDRRK